MIKPRFRFNQQFENEKQTEAVLKISYPYYIRTMTLGATVTALYELLMIIRILLGGSSGGTVKHIHYGCCYVFLILLCLTVVISLTFFKKDLDKHGKKIYFLEIIFMIGACIWAILIICLDLYYHNTYEVTLYISVLLVLSLISFINPHILISIQLFFDVITLLIVMKLNNIGAVINLVTYASITLVISTAFHNTRKGLFIKQYQLDEIEIKQLNNQLADRQTQLEQLTQEQAKQIKEITQLNANLQEATAAAESASKAKSLFLSICLTTFEHQ